MATVDDVEVANASFPNVRQDLNDILEALATNFSADDEPTTTYPNQFWYETDTNLLYIRNEANDAWVTLASINQTSGEWEPRTAVIQAIDSAGLALKTDDGTTRFSISDAGVVSFENYSFPSADGSDGQVLTTDGAGNLTFESGGAGDKIEEGNSSVEVVDTGTGYVAVTVDGTETARFDANGRLGIGTNSPDKELEISANDSVALRLTSTDTTLSGNALLGSFEVYGNEASGAGAGIKSAIQAYTATGDGAGSDLRFFTSAGTTNNTEGMRLDREGNLRFNSGYGSVATAYGCRAWVNFDGTGTPSIREDGNVSSISDRGTGQYTVNFSTSLVDANYAPSLACRKDNNVDDANFDFTLGADGGNFSTSALDITIRRGSDGAVDTNRVCVAIFR